MLESRSHDAFLSRVLSIVSHYAVQSSSLGTVLVQSVNNCCIVIGVASISGTARIERSLISLILSVKVGGRLV